MSSSANSFNPSDYQFMLKSLSEGNYVTKAESLKKLNVLITKDKKQFSIYAKRIVLAIQDLMFQQKEDLNLLSSTLALQIINANPREIQYYIRSKLLKSMVCNLGDAKPQIRKTSHYCLLAYVKTYKSFDQLIQVYLNMGIQSQEWQLRQKAINSLQSILIMQMKYINWGSNQFKRVFQVLLIKLKDQNAYVQKATQQCLLSLCKIEDVRAFSKKLTPQDFIILRNFCQAQHSAGTLPQIKLDLQQKILNIPSYRNFQQSKQQSLKAIENTGHSLLNLQKIRLAQQNSQKRAILNRIEEIKRHNSNHHTPKVQKQQVQSLRKADSVVMVNQLKQMKRKAIQKQKQRLSQIRLQPIKKQSFRIQRQTIEPKVQKAQKTSQNLITRKLIDDLKNDKDWKIRLQAIQEFQAKFQSNKQSFQIQSLLKTYLPILVKLLADANFKVALISLKILQDILLMPGISIDLIAPHLIEKLSDNKIALRQNISKLIRSQFIRTKENIWIDCLLTQLKKSNNSNTKEQILSILNKLYQEEYCSAYSTSKVIQAICPLMQDLKTKIKIKTLDLLVLATVKSTNPIQTKNFLMGKLNQVYYQMYSEKLSKQMKNKNVSVKQPSLNLSTQQSNPISSSRENRAQNLINKRYSKNSGNTTSTSLQRDKNNSVLNPNQTVRTSSFIERSSKRDTATRKTEEPDNTVSKISLHDPQISSPSKANEKKKSFLKSFRKKVHRTFDNKSTNYSTGEDFQPFDEPQKQLRNILVDIKSQDWQISFQALNKTKIIICHHKQLLNPLVLKLLLPQIVRLAQNLRSSLSKNAVMTLNQLSMQIKRGLDSELEMIINKLIKKSLDANSFISEEVKKVLVTICSNGNQNKVISILTASHTARAIPIKQVIVHVLQNVTFLPKFFEKQLQKIVFILNNFMGQGSLQIRQKTKTILNQILSSDKGKQISRLISPEHLVKLKKQSQIIPQLKIIEKEQSKIQPKQQQIKQIFIETGKKKKQKINVFPEQFNQIQGLLQKCQSSDWKIRSESMSQIQQIYMNFPDEASQHRINNKIIDVLSKQIGDPNVKVATNALRIFKNFTNTIPSLIENNLSVISNELFTCFASQKQQVKNLSQQLFDQISQTIQSWMLLQHMCNGVLYGLQKSKGVIIEKLVNIVPSTLKAKANIFQKNVYPMINKTVEEGKPELMVPLKKLLSTIYDQIGQNCFDYLKPKSKQLMKS